MRSKADIYFLHVVPQQRCDPSDFYRPEFDTNDWENCSEIYYRAKPDALPTFLVTIVERGKDYLIEETVTRSFYSSAYGPKGELLVMQWRPYGVGWAKVDEKSLGWSDGVGDQQIWRRRRRRA